MHRLGNILIIAGVVFITIAAIVAFSLPILESGANAEQADAVFTLTIALIGIGTGILGAMLRHWNQ
jgi:hypothetical protein